MGKKEKKRKKRILEQVATSFSRDLTDPGIKPTSPASSALAGGFLFFFFFPAEPLGKPYDCCTDGVDI